LNVAHTAPEAVALSGLSYGGTDDIQVHVTIPIPSRISNLFVTPHECTPCGSHMPVLHTEGQQGCAGDIPPDARLASILHASF